MKNTEPKQLSKDYKKTLEVISERVLKELYNGKYNYRINRVKINIEEPGSNGFCTDVFKVKKIPGVIVFWIDHLPNVGRPIFSVSYSNGDMNKINQIVETFSSLENIATFTSSDFAEDKKYNTLKNPLPASKFKKYVKESYKEYRFLTIFLPDKIYPSKINSKLIDNIAMTTEKIIGNVITSLEGKVVIKSALENKRIFTTHLRRERKSTYVVQVKIRDGYTCQICDFNGSRKFGVVGNGAIEVHHKFPLSNSKKQVRTQPEDLITVCANCHRMLHRMEGSPKDIYKLKKMIYQKT